jgi:hypothetical protein
VTAEVRSLERGLPVPGLTTVPTADQVAAAHDVEKEAAKVKVAARRQSLRAFLDTQTRIFGEVQAEQAKKDNFFGKPDVIVIAQKLTELKNNVYPEWDAALADTRTAASEAAESANDLPTPARGWWQKLHDLTFKDW